MPQVDVPIPRETALRLRIALLELETAQLQARLLRQDAEHGLTLAQCLHQQTVVALLAAVHPDLPAPQTPLTLDVEASVVRYEVADPCTAVDIVTPSV